MISVFKIFRWNFKITNVMRIKSQVLEQDIFHEYGKVEYFNDIKFSEKWSYLSMLLHLEKLLDPRVVFRYLVADII